MAVGGYIRRMWRQRVAVRRLSVPLVVGLAALAFGGSAHGGTACADAVLADWTRGALGSGYAPECYEAAIDSLPEDLRAYTSAADDITRAAIDANRNEDVVATGSRSERQLADIPAEGGELRSFPTEVAVLVGGLTMLFSCGLAAALLRRRRGR